MKVRNWAAFCSLFFVSLSAGAGTVSGKDRVLVLLGGWNSCKPTDDHPRHSPIGMPFLRNFNVLKDQLVQNGDRVRYLLTCYGVSGTKMDFRTYSDRGEETTILVSGVLEEQNVENFEP